MERMIHLYFVGPPTVTKEKIINPIGREVEKTVYTEKPLSAQPKAVKDKYTFVLRLMTLVSEKGIAKPQPNE
jgi:hypothetical protein